MSDILQPILPGSGATDYERYLRTDELLALQKAPDQMGHRDELLFQTVHQSSELWLKLACFEVETATSQIGAGDVARATRLLRRANDAMRLVVEHLHMLEHISPADFHGVRRELGHGAGFDSPGFNRVTELTPHLGEAFQALLVKRDVSVLDVYQGEYELDDLFELAERLIDWDAQVLIWRHHHLHIVHRTIGGHVIGTQGTPVEVLGRRLNVRFFPFLWDVRDKLTEIAGTSPASPAPGHSR